MDKSMESLIDSITQRVLQELTQQQNNANSQCQTAKALVIGPQQLVPGFLCENTCLCSVDDATEPVDNYSKIIITSLTTTQLADIASGLGACPQTNAVCQALLRGADVYMTASAPEHRKYAGRCSESFYQLFEGYVDRIISYGVKIADQSRCTEASKPEKMNCCKGTDTGTVCSCKLITEKDALRMASEKKTLTVGRNVIITPSAKDVFLHAGVTVYTQREE